jgi:hypothetical protein
VILLLLIPRVNMRENLRANLRDYVILLLLIPRVNMRVNLRANLRDYVIIQERNGKSLNKRRSRVLIVLFLRKQKRR